MKHVTLQKIVAHDFRYDPRTSTQQLDSPAVRYTVYEMMLPMMDWC